MAGCILVDFDMIQVINRSPKYKNKYVHRRTSVSVASLTEEEMEERRRLGLIRTSVGDAEYYRMKRETEEEEEEEEEKIAKKKKQSSRAKSVQDENCMDQCEGNANHIPSF